MHFVITPGVQYLIGGGFSLGLSGGFDLMSESISHEVIDPRESYVYFRFNGLGDFSTISTGTSLSYPRNYTGTEYTGALQFAWDGGRGVANLLEATCVEHTGPVTEALPSRSSAATIRARVSASATACVSATPGARTTSSSDGTTSAWKVSGTNKPPT